MSCLETKYELKRTFRENYLYRATEISKLTLPWVMTERRRDLKDWDYYESGLINRQTWQSVGSMGVNNLAGVLVTALFPSGQSWTDVKIEGQLRNDVAESDRLKTEQQIIQAIQEEANHTGFRSQLLKYLMSGIIAGGCLMRIPSKTGSDIEVFHADEFVIKRSRSSRVLELIIRTSKNTKELDKKTKEMLRKALDVQRLPKRVFLFTGIKWNAEKKLYEVWKEYEKGVEAENVKTFTEDTLEYVYLPFRDTGEQYGRSPIEDYMGDLTSYDKIRQMLLTITAISAKVVFAVSPENAMFLPNFESKESGEFAIIDPAGIKAVQVDKFQDLQVVQLEAEGLRKTLSQAFLLSASGIRNAERVTAQEILMVQRETDLAMAGLFSQLTLFQERVSKLLLERVKNRFSIIKELGNDLNITVTTGLNAINKHQQAQNLSQWATAFKQLFAQDPSGSVSAQEFGKRLAKAMDIEIENLFIDGPSPEQMMQEIQRLQQENQQMAMQLQGMQG